MFALVTWSDYLLPKVHEVVEELIIPLTSFFVGFSCLNCARLYMQSLIFGLEAPVSLDFGQVHFLYLGTLIYVIWR